MLEIFDYDSKLADESYGCMTNVNSTSDHSYVEVGETEVYTDFRKKEVYPDEDYFVVFVKKTIHTIIFSLDEVSDKTNQYIVHAEELCDFVFDEKDPELVWTCEPTKGKRLIENGGY
ncbi:hypothetical protein IGK74_002353 [Enterococcus sp. AZ150]|uniref:hypothetical protein n=1 Tax=Enterococcus sp. AZ150 TaxID=2774866 RepID=UPI003F2010F0